MGSNKGLAKWQRRPPPRLPHMMGKKEKARSVCAVIGPFTASHPRSTHDSVRVPMRVPVSSIPDLFCIHARCEQESTATMYSCDYNIHGTRCRSLLHELGTRHTRFDANAAQIHHFRGLVDFQGYYACTTDRAARHALSRALCMGHRVQGTLSATHRDLILRFLGSVIQ